jgi:BirA family biotin operon repressor/biotin-[acetyl-CoA-carboxylase] ligase
MSSDTELIAALRRTSFEPISASELADALALTRSELAARIESLRRLGYDIVTDPYKGCQLVNSPDSLHPEDLHARLPSTLVVGRDIRVFQQTHSTNDVIEKLARDGVREGVVVFAESQTGGRGRLGRKWYSPAGKGLWMSVLLRPHFPPDLATQVTVAAAISVVRAIRCVTGLSPQIKWPNDLLLAGKKVAGILTELRAELDQIRYLILGLGINVNLAGDEIPAELQPIATSLQEAAGSPIDRPALAAAVIQELDDDYARLTAGNFDAIADEWEQQCATIGRNIILQRGDRSLAGRAEALDADGALLLRTRHGHLERITAGDVIPEV